MPAIGPLEIGVVLLIVLLIVGPKKLPGLGRNLGTGMREFKDSINSRGGDDSDDEPAKIEVAAADSTPVAEPSAAPEKQPRGDA
jgi:sec-independent protein translocase protein TatA